MLVEGVRFTQEGMTLFSTAIRAADLLKITEVDVYGKEEGGEYSGYQRAPELSRARKFAAYLKDARMPLAPTAALLNAREGLPESNGNGLRRLEFPDDLKLWVIDGQHRLAGFRYAIEDLGIGRVRDYQVPVVIADRLTIEQEAEQFRIINETAKKVRTDLARRILAIGASTPEGRRQLRDQLRLWEAVAAEVSQALNTDLASPLCGRIQGPNEKKTPRHTVREISFATSLRPILSTFPYKDWTSRRIANQLCDYWQVWKNIVPEPFDNPESYLLLGTSGVFSLHQVALHVWEVCRRRNEEPTVPVLTNMIAELDSFTTADYWLKDNIDGASVYGSMKGFGIIADQMKDHLHFKGFTTE